MPGAAVAGAARNPSNVGRWTRRPSPEPGGVMLDRTSSTSSSLPSVPAPARRILLVLTAAIVFSGTWLYRHNYPDGSVAGLTNDHYFYLSRGWQMLFGDRPDQHFIDPGAPLTFVLEYWAQLVLGRGVWSEYVFCVTALSAGAAATYVLAARASGSVLLGLVAVALEIALAPRFYNYPKIVVYAGAVPALWAVIDRPVLGRWAVLAVATVLAFLWRHDHGVNLALVTALTILLSAGWTWRQRMGHAVVYGGMTLILLAPYAGYLAVSGGVIRHFDAAMRWSARDRARAPYELPHFALSPAVFNERANGVDAEDPWFRQPPYSGLTANSEAWLFWVLVALPIVVLIVLARHRDAGRPSWPRARLKILAVALLAIVLNVAFLRSPLSARFGDVAVPHAILIGWLLSVTLGTVWRARATPRRLVLRAAVGFIAAIVTVITVLVLMPEVAGRLDESQVLESFDKSWQRTLDVSDQIQGDAQLENWVQRDDPGPTRLAYYARDCTRPDDRLFVGLYYSEVAALAGRAFAGGYPELRADFFNTAADQRLTIARLQSQSVPVVIMPVGKEAESFTRSFPFLDAYLRERYVDAGVRDLGGEQLVDVLVDKRARATRRYEPLDLPCFR